MENIKFYLALAIGKVIAFVENLVSKTKGTSFSGKCAFKICKDFIKGFKNIDYNKVVFVTGINRKSTTNNMIVNALQTDGKTVTTNLEGLGTIYEIATAMIKNSTIAGKIKTEYIVLEIDERYLRHIYSQLPAKNICVTNLQKSQTQRNEEPDYAYQKIKSIMNNDINLFINNEEPRAKSLEDMGCKPIYYGVERNEKSFEKNNFYDITLPCPKCNSKIKFEYYNTNNIGKFECINCDFKSEENIEYVAKNVNYEEKTIECQNTRYTIEYAQPFLIYNYCLCIAICKTLGISKEKIQESFINLKNINERPETIKYKDKEIKCICIKQEDSEILQSALNYVAQDETNKILILALEEIKDIKPHYTNTFYGFDCDYENLKKSSIEEYICFSDIVAYDSANVLRYAGIEKEKIKILQAKKIQDLADELDKHNTKNVYLITLPYTYNALQKYVKILEKQEAKEAKRNAKHSLGISGHTKFTWR